MPQHGPIGLRKPDKAFQCKAMRLLRGQRQTHRRPRIQHHLQTHFPFVILRVAPQPEFPRPHQHHRSANGPLGWPTRPPAATNPTPDSAQGWTWRTGKWGCHNRPTPPNKASANMTHRPQTKRPTGKTTGGALCIRWALHSGRSEAFEHQRTVGAAKTEIVFQRYVDFHVARRIGAVVQITLGIGVAPS